MNDLLKFSSDVKPRASLYCVAILFLVCMLNLVFGLDSVSVYFILQVMIVSVIIALIEYALFHHYDELSQSKKTTSTIIWALSINVLIILSAVIFNWVGHFPIYVRLLLIMIMEIGLVFVRYTFYLQNLYDTKALNEKLKKYQKEH